MANLCIKTPSSAILVLIFQLLVLRPRPSAQAECTTKLFDKFMTHFNSLHILPSLPRLCNINRLNSAWFQNSNLLYIPDDSFFFTFTFVWTCVDPPAWWCSWHRWGKVLEAALSLSSPSVHGPWCALALEDSQKKCWGCPLACCALRSELSLLFLVVVVAMM